MANKESYEEVDAILTREGGSSRTEEKFVKVPPSFSCIVLSFPMKIYQSQFLLSQAQSGFTMFLVTSRTKREQHPWILQKIHSCYNQNCIEKSNSTIRVYKLQSYSKYIYSNILVSFFPSYPAIQLTTNIFVETFTYSQFQFYMDLLNTVVPKGKQWMRNFASLQS